MKNKFIEKLEFFLIYNLYSISKIISEKALKKILRKILFFGLKLLNNQKKIIYKNLEIINPFYSKDEKDKIFKKFCFIFAEILSDQLFFPRFTQEKIFSKMSVEGYDNVKKALEKGKGAIVVLGHLGNWEIFGTHASLSGIKLNVIYRPLDNKLLDKFLSSFRIKYGTRIISKFSTPLAMIKPLIQNEILCVVADQNTIKNHIYIPFFGKIAAASRGFSFFHLKTKSPVFFAYSLIDDSFNQYGFIEKEYDFEQLYNNLNLEEKFFLHSFNETFNLSEKSDYYHEKLNKFFSLFSYEDRFSPIKSEIYYEEIDNFESKLKKYEELDFDEKTFYITYFFHRSLENIIKKYPENWFLLHPRFRKQPEGIKSLYK